MVDNSRRYVLVLVLAALLLGAAASAQVPQYGYTGREPDKSGLIYYRGRYLDPTTGRFTQRDPIGWDGGVNDYDYVENSPITRIDPFGMEPKQTTAQTIMDSLAKATCYFACADEAEAAEGGKKAAAKPVAYGPPEVNQLITKIMNTGPGTLHDEKGNQFPGERPEALIRAVLDPLAKSLEQAEREAAAKAGVAPGTIPSRVGDELDHVLRINLIPTVEAGIVTTTREGRWANQVLQEIVRQYQVLSPRHITSATIAAANIRSNPPYNEKIDVTKDWRIPPKNFK